MKNVWMNDIVVQINTAVNEPGHAPGITASRLERIFQETLGSIDLAIVFDLDLQGFVALSRLEINEQEDGSRVYIAATAGEASQVFLSRTDILHRMHQDCLTDRGAKKPGESK